MRGERSIFSVVFIFEIPHPNNFFVLQTAEAFSFPTTMNHSHHPFKTFLMKLTALVTLVPFVQLSVLSLFSLLDMI